MTEPQRETEPQLMELTECVCPWQGDRPVVLNMGETSDKFLPLFSTAEKLHEMMDPIGIPYESVKQMSNTSEFINSLPRSLPDGDLRIIFDPHWLEDGALRFAEIVAPN